ncbi:MAG: amidohydrolase family protein, partial [Myxococcota bacterium]
IIGRATGPLLQWLETSVFPEEARLNRRRYAARVATEMIDRMIAMGTTTAAVFSSSSETATHAFFAEAERRGIRAFAGMSFMDVRSPKALRVARKEALAGAERLYRRWHGTAERLFVAVTPRFALSCSKSLLRDAGRFAAEHELVIQTHIGETLEEGRRTLEVFRDAKHYVDVYERAGLLTERTILAHAIHLSAAEWRRVVARGASIAHCPDSNFFLGSGRMKSKAALERGVVVGLGSDVAAGRSFSIRRAMAHGYDNALAVGAPLTQAQLFHMATVGGARALGLAGDVGTLEVGKYADLAVYTVRTSIREADAILAELVFDTDAPRASDVYVAGRRLSPEH